MSEWKNDTARRLYLQWSNDADRMKALTRQVKQIKYVSKATNSSPLEHFICVIDSWFERKAYGSGTHEFVREVYEASLGDRIVFGGIRVWEASIEIGQRLWAHITTETPE